MAEKDIAFSDLIAVLLLFLTLKWCKIFWMLFFGFPLFVFRFPDTHAPYFVRLRSFEIHWGGGERGGGEFIYSILINNTME
jgi:hypothetical protein